MNRKFLLLGLVPLALCLVTTSVSAKAEIWYHDVGNDVGSDTQTIIMPLPPSFYPFTQVKWTSIITWSYHWVYNTVFDGSQNLHNKVEYTSRGTVQSDFWYWNEDLQEWIYAGGWFQKLSNIWGQNELIVDLFSETQTSKQLNIGHETYMMEMTDPLTGEEIAFEYMVIRYMMVKYVNGQLQFENQWEIRREE